MAGLEPGCGAVWTVEPRFVGVEHPRHDDGCRRWTRRWLHVYVRRGERLCVGWRRMCRHNRDERACRHGDRDCGPRLMTYRFHMNPRTMETSAFASVIAISVRPAMRAVAMARRICRLSLEYRKPQRKYIDMTIDDEIRTAEDRRVSRLDRRTSPPPSDAIVLGRAILRMFGGPQIPYKPFNGACKSSTFG